MKIGIMGAMMEEVSLLKDNMSISSIETIGNREYYLGKLYNVDTVLVFSRWGKVASSSTATTLINTFKVNFIIFTGVAGASSQHLNVGDIIVVNDAYQYDMDARPHFQKNEIPLTGKTFFQPSAKSVSNTEHAAKNFVQKDFQMVISEQLISDFSLDPKVYIGLVASGDRFIGDNQSIKEIKDDNPYVLAVEMEGAAVAQVCFEHDIDFTIIRTVSDKADHNAAIDTVKFFTQVAKYYSQGIVKNLYEIINIDCVPHVTLKPFY